jgi:hypothetical protein
MENEKRYGSPREVFVALAVGVLMYLGLVLVLVDALNRPEVLISTSSGKCVDVINFIEENNYTCDNKPPKYSVTWVQ